MNIPINKDGTLKWHLISQDQEKKIIVAKLNKDDLKKYNYLIWYNSMPYDSIIEAIDVLAKKIKENL